MNEDVLKIIKHYGVNAQQRKLAEEVFELQEAITQYEEPRVYRDTNQIAEELSDVMVMLKQFRVYYNISDKTINTIMRKKIQRQLERIKKEVEHE